MPLAFVDSYLGAQVIRVSASANMSLVTKCCLAGQKGYVSQLYAGGSSQGR